MSHGRKLIRHAVRDLLINKTSAGERIYTNRRTALWDNALPAIVIFTTSQDDELYSVSPRELMRTAQIGIELVVAKEGEIPLDDEMDDLCEQVERVLFNNPMLRRSINSKDSPVARPILPLRTETDTNYDGLKPIGGLRMNWEAIYFQSAGEYETCALADFKTTEIDWDLAPPDSAIDATDLVDANA